MKIIKIPTHKAGLGNSSPNAPTLICNKLKKYELNENLNKINFQIDEIKTSPNLDETGLNIYQKAKTNALFLGGDHSLTYYTFKAFAEKHKNPGLIIFDAHPDCEVYTKTPTHEDFVRKLIEDKILKKENLILVGIRNLSKNELNFIKQNKIIYYTPRQIFSNHEFICDSIMETLRTFDAFYLSIDIDILDPSCAPGTGYPEPGGLQTRELIYFLQRLKLLNNLKSIDLVEVNPEKDINNQTIDTAVKLIWEISKDF